MTRARTHDLARILWCIIAAGILVHPTLLPKILAQSKNAAHSRAPKPLFRDPVHDGAADPSLAWDRAKHRWLMFYTNRRADLPSNDPNDVAWVHGTKIGVAESKDLGTTWNYVGTANLPYGELGYTFWAPDVVWNDGLYHMLVTVVPGIFHDWNAKREIVHFTSKDLMVWQFVSKLQLSSDRTIDPCVLKLADGRWRLWYKDEQDHSYIHFADSPDLYHWTPAGTAISDRPSEGPVVFRWKGQMWMIVDAWNGLGVYRSVDAEHWERQPENLLADSGRIATDRSKGHHTDVIVSDGRAFLFYFVQQEGADAVPGVPNADHRSVLQVVELQDHGNKLTADRDAPVFVVLVPGADK